MAKRESAGRRGDPPAPLVQALGAVAQWLDARATPGAIIGGVAASILGRPRLTDDIDVLVLLEREAWPDFLVAGREFGFVPRIEDALDFADASRVLLASHQPSGVRVDVVFGALSLEDEIVRSATRVEIAGNVIPLPTPESIVVMKAVAGRTRDIVDIEGILEVHERLDLAWIRAWLSEFDQALGQSDILDEFNRVVTRAWRPTAFDDPPE